MHPLDSLAQERLDSARRDHSAHLRTAGLWRAMIASRGRRTGLMERLRHLASGRRAPASTPCAAPNAMDAARPARTG